MNHIAGENGRVEPKRLITEDDLDLTVDYNSDVEDELSTDVLPTTRRVLNLNLGDHIEQGGYSGNASEFWEYLREVSSFSTSTTQTVMREYLEENGVESWLKKYVIEDQQPFEILFYSLGVLLTREQRNSDNMALLPLLKAAAFRYMRCRWMKRLSHPPTREYNLSLLLQRVVDRIQTSKNIIVLSGAGISVSCGIPDFRSQNGLYAQLASSGNYDLDDPQQMFDINYFRHNPFVFYSFAHKIYPTNFTPSRCHRFIRTLEMKGKLLRNYTQNIDGLEARAGIRRVVQCHGSFATATCVNCQLRVHGDAIKDALLAQRIPLCPSCNTETVLMPKKIRRKKKKKKRNDGWESEEPEEILPPLPPGIMKPDIIFFGEKLPNAFDKAVFEDIKRADLMIVIGTSLKVRPVSEIAVHLPHRVDTIVINKTPLPHISPEYQLLGDADVVVKRLAHCLHWKLDTGEGMSVESVNSSTPINTVSKSPQATSDRKKVIEAGFDLFVESWKDYDVNAKSVNGSTSTSTALKPEVKRNKKKAKYKVIGQTGVFLFKGAEGGEFVDKLLADRALLNPLSIEKVKECELSESDSSDLEDESSINGSMTESRSRKRTRRLLE